MQLLILITLLPFALALPAFPPIPPIPPIPSVPRPLFPYFSFPPRCVCEPKICIPSYPASCYCANNNAISCYLKCGGPFPVIRECPLYPEILPLTEPVPEVSILPAPVLEPLTLPTPEIAIAKLPAPEDPYFPVMPGPVILGTELPIEPTTFLPVATLPVSTIPVATLPVATFSPVATLPVATLPPFTVPGGPIKTLPIDLVAPVETVATDPSILVDPLLPVSLPLRPRPSPIKAECGSLNLPGCPAGQQCVRIPGASCGPEADCGGICVIKEYLFCGGFAAIRCPKGLRCVDDPRDDCDPRYGGADCGGICV